MSNISSSATSSIAVFDGRPFFEKALKFGVQHGILDSAKLEAIQTDAPKGMVQIARYFGSEFLRPELEKAKDRIVNLVSLTLQIQSGGDLRKAAEHLREHSFMSRSKAASDMLKAIIVNCCRGAGDRIDRQWIGRKAHRDDWLAPLGKTDSASSPLGRRTWGHHLRSAPLSRAGVALKALGIHGLALCWHRRCTNVDGPRRLRQADQCCAKRREFFTIQMRQILADCCQIVKDKGKPTGGHHRALRFNQRSRLPLLKQEYASNSGLSMRDRPQLDAANALNA